MPVTIRPLLSLDEMYAAVDLQKVYWGDEIESVIPAHMLFSLANNGGHVLAAVDGDRLVGLLVGFLGTDMIASDRPAMANLRIASKRMVVLPEYRNQGLAYRLKLAQRDVAMQQGVRLVVWTFDPLLAANAHLNIRKLGAVAEEFVENYYGTSDHAGGIVSQGMSDRLVADWWVTHNRVKERISGTRRDLQLVQYLDAGTGIINPTSADAGGVAHPSATLILPDSAMVLLEIPLDFPAILASDEALALAWRRHTREVFNLLMRRGYVVTDFVHDRHEGRERAFYLLSPGSRGYDFNPN